MNILLTIFIFGTWAVFLWLFLAFISVQLKRMLSENSQKLLNSNIDLELKQIDLKTKNEFIEYELRMKRLEVEINEFNFENAKQSLDAAQEYTELITESIKGSAGHPEISEISPDDQIISTIFNGESYPVLFDEEEYNDLEY